MKSIKKRIAKARIISKVIQYDEEDNASFSNGELNVTEDSERIEESSTLTTDCTIADKGGRIEIAYDESEITGMEGASTRLFFDKDTPTLVSLLREGTVSTALVFESGRRHLCVYETPYFPIELCVSTLSMNNALSFEGGTFSAEYLVEMNGVLAEKTKITLSIIG